MSHAYQDLAGKRRYLFLSNSIVRSNTSSGWTNLCEQHGSSLSDSVIKSQTYLWLPDDNSTLSNLPTGLQRYTGEQDFFLVVVNVSTMPGCQYCEGSISQSVPLPWGGSYTLSLTHSADEQMTNFLIPRSQFLNSPLGEAILEGRNFNASLTQNLPIVGENSAGLACYWQGLAVAPNGVDGSTGPTLCNGQSGTWTSGTNPNTQYAISTLADTENCTQDLGSSANCQAGGVPSNPALATSSPGNAAPALQAVVTLNLTSNSDLTYLLAALLDNNTTVASGQLGVNGHFVSVTDQIPTLGLNSVILSTLANSSQSDGGVFGPPCAVCVPALPGAVTLEMLHLHPRDLFSFFAGLWNSFSGVVAALLAHLSSFIHALVGIIWNALLAAAVYFDHIRQGLAHLAEAAVSAAVSALKAVANALEAALQALLAFVEKEVTSFLQDALAAVTTAIKDLTSQYASPVLDGLLAGSGAGTATFGPPMQILFVLGATVTTALFVAVGVLSVVTLGTGDIILFVAPLLISLAFQALGNDSPFSPDVGSLRGLAFGQTMWQGAVSSTGPSVNAIAALQGDTLDSNAQSDLSTAITNIRTSADLTGGLIALAAAIGLAATGNGPTGAIGLAALGLGMAIAGFLLFGYLLTTTQSNEQVSSTIGGIADLLSASLATMSIVLLVIALSRGLPEPAPIVFGIIMFFEGVVLLADGLLLLPVLESM